jgi:hypothetical protein
MSYRNTTQTSSAAFAPTGGEGGYDMRGGDRSNVRSASIGFDGSDTTGQPAVPQFRSPGSQVVGGTKSVTIHADGSSTYEDTGRTYSVGAGTPEHEQHGSVTASARTQGGLPVSAGNIKDDTIVRAGGYEMKAVLAEQLGFLTRSPAGLYVDAQQADNSGAAEAQQAAEQAQLEALTGGKVEALDDAAEGLLSSYIAAAGQSPLIGAVHQYINDGAVSDGMLATIASRMGEEPAQTAANIETVRAAFEQQASRVVEQASGLPATLVFKIAHETKDPGLAEAMREQVINGGTDRYRAVAERAVGKFIDGIAAGKYATAVEVDPSSGITMRRDGRNFVLTIPGQGQVELRSALRAGLVSVKATG